MCSFTKGGCEMGLDGLEKNTCKWRRRVGEFFKLQDSKETTEQESQRDLFLGRKSFLIPTGQRN